MFTVVGAYCQQKSFKVEVYGSGQPIILIPGYSCSGDVWKATVDNLKGNYQLHVLTLAGFAGVPPIDTPILKTVKNDLIKYVKDNHLNKPVLIGHSLGAFMSLWVASEEPSLFSKILCVDGVPFISAMSNPSITAEEIKKNPAYNAEAMAANFKNMPEKEFEDNQFKAGAYHGKRYGTCKVDHSMGQCKRSKNTGLYICGNELQPISGMKLRKLISRYLF